MILNLKQIIDNFIFSIWIDVSIEDSETVYIPDGIGYFSKRLYLFFIWNTFFKDSFPLSFQSTEQVEYKFL